MRLVRKFCVGGVALAIAALLPSVAAAESYTFDSCISANWSGCSTLPSQLKVEVTQVGDEYVDFTFTNDIGIESSITAIYFDTGSSLFTAIAVEDESDGVEFEAGNPTPPDVPSSTGATPPFEVTTIGKGKTKITLGADSAGSPEGLDEPGEFVTLRLTLADGVAFADIIKALDEGAGVDSLRIAAHIQSLPGGLSDSVICCGSGDGTPSPEPASIFLFGLLALAAAYRLRG